MYSSGPVCYRNLARSLVFHRVVLSTAHCSRLLTTSRFFLGLAEGKTLPRYATLKKQNIPLTLLGDSWLRSN